MSAVVPLERLLDARRVWRGRTEAAPAGLSTGLAALDAVLPCAGWPAGALSEVLHPADGVGELEMLWPALSQLSANGRVTLVAPPYLPCAPAWHAAGIRLEALQVIDARGRDAWWAAEQCLRSGACAAVLCWPGQVDDRVLRRLQVAAEAGQAYGFALRHSNAAANPSPAALRVSIEPGAPRQVRVIKCRGGLAPPRPVPFPYRQAR